MSKFPISCFIIAKNEADRIATTINSVKNWVTEVIVIDSGSTDGTMKAAEQAGAKAIFHEWQGYGLQKRFGEDQCSQSWLLNLDADEIVSDALAEEIQALFARGEPAHQGYFLKVTHMLPGERKAPPVTQVNTVLRLYNKNHGRFSDHAVHDSVIMQSGSTAVCEQPVWHPSYRSIAHAVEKINFYSSMQVNSMGRQYLVKPRLYVEFPVTFLKAYFLRGYVMRGHRGFVYAMVYAFSRFIRLAKYAEDHYFDPKDKRP